MFELNVSKMTWFLLKSEYYLPHFGDYYTEPRILFPVEHSDERMHPKEIILGFYIDEIYKAYKQDDLELMIVTNDEIGNVPILLTSLYSGNARAFERVVDGKILDFEFSDGKILDLQTGSEWNYDGHAISGEYKGQSLNRLTSNPGFWFEWVAFHPQTEVFGA